MAEYIRRGVRGNYRSSLSQVVLDSTKITEDTYRNIFGRFWVPSDILTRENDRIRSRSLDLSCEEAESDRQTEQRIHQDIENETGVNLAELSRSIGVISEVIEEKTEHIRELESQLEESEQMVHEYTTRIQRFAEDMDVIGGFMDGPPQNTESFLSGLRERFVSELMRRNLSEKLSQHEILVSQVRQMRPIIQAVLTRGAEVTGPICKICMEAPVSFVIDPCGHCYCQSCSGRVSEERRCYICRRGIQKLIRMYT